MVTAVVLDSTMLDLRRRVEWRARNLAPPALASFMPKFLGFKSASISYESEGNTRRLSIDGVGSQEVAGLPGMGGDTLVLTHTGHPISDDLAMARATTAVFKDEHFKIDNTGKNGHFAPFNWKG